MHGLPKYWHNCTSCCLHFITDTIQLFYKTEPFHLLLHLLLSPFYNRYHSTVLQNRTIPSVFLSSSYISILFLLFQKSFFASILDLQKKQYAIFPYACQALLRIILNFDN